jgi:hypothetical protein
MELLKRTGYFLYYLQKLDRELFRKFSAYVHEQYQISLWRQYGAIIRHSFRYNASILEYYQFRFFNSSHQVKSDWAGTGFMYEYQLQMNPRDTRGILDDKRSFYRAYQEFFKHLVLSHDQMAADIGRAVRLLANGSGRIVVKRAHGKCGAGVQVCNARDFSPGSLLEFMDQNEYDLAEEFILQHPALQELSPAAVNTVRIFTQLDGQGNVDILGCRLRISISAPVDNLAAGNLAAPIDEVSGVVTGPGVYSDMTKPEEQIHPVTGRPIQGFRIPYWSEVLRLATNAALKHPQNRSIGWDIVITPEGPGLIEGNHDWCKLLWQLPVKKGLKPMLQKYLE